MRHSHGITPCLCPLSFLPSLSPLSPPSPSVLDDANTTLLNVLTTNLHIVLEWSPPPLSEPLEGDLPSISDFSVDQYILLKDAEELNRLGSNVTEYIYTVEEDDGGSTQFRIKTVYSDYLINDLTPETKLVVDIPTEEGEWKTCIHCVCV